MSHLISIRGQDAIEDSERSSSDERLADMTGEKKNCFSREENSYENKN